MGITIRGDWKGSPEWDMGYASFFRLRRDVAYFVSKEFGDHYANLTRINPFDANEYDGITKWLIKKYHCKKRCIDFLYAPDSGYRLSPFKCKAVLDLIANGEETGIDNKTLYGYTARPENCMTIYNFIDLLAACYDKRKALVWY